MKKTIISSAMFAAILLASPAAAQEEGSNFSGLTATVLGGFDSVRVKDVTINETDSQNGFVYGGAIGYDYNMRGAVIGLETELTGATTKRRVEAGNDFAQIKAGRDIYVGARIGTTVTDNVLLYAKAGYTNARFRYSESIGGVSYSEGENYDGYRLGAGAEVAYGQMFGRVEYRFSDYGRPEDGDLALKRHQVVAGFGYRF